MLVNFRTTKDQGSSGKYRLFQAGVLTLKEGRSTNQSSHVNSVHVDYWMTE